MKVKISMLLLIVFGLLQGCSKDTNSENQEDTINVNANKQATGSSSNDLLSDDTFARMEIELAYVEGFEPTQQAINNFVSFLEARTYKPDGIVVEKKAIPSSGKTTFTIDEIADIENTHRTNYNNGNTIAV